MKIHLCKFVILHPELRKPASTANVLAEHSGIPQEQIGPKNITSPPEDINWNKWIPNHVNILFWIVQYHRNAKKRKFAWGTPQHFFSIMLGLGNLR